MLDPGRYLAEAIYFLLYTLAQVVWAADRALLSIAVITESINSWVTGNVGYFVELLTGSLSAVLGGMFILALTLLGFWYGLNNILPTPRWVDPSRLFTYGLIAFFFFSSPIVAVELMEELRAALNAGVDPALIDAADGELFDAGMDGTDTGLSGGVPDVNSDGFLGSFDLVAAFLEVVNLDELDSGEFPADFEAAYFPFGDPAGIDLSDEADQQLAQALAGDGVERLFFALLTVPTAICEHFLRLALTGVAVFLYLGVPFAMLFAFFVYTQAFLGAYLRQFVNLLIETFLSVIITAIMVRLLVAAAAQGIGLFIGAAVIACIVLIWRIHSAMKLATASFNLFGGGALTGGAGGMEVVTMGKQAVMGVAGLAGAALTGGATMAIGGAVLGTAAALRADERHDGAYLGLDPAKADGRVAQLQTMGGYALGRTQLMRNIIERSHEVRMLGRNFRDGEAQAHEPDTLDYLRAGSSMSGFGSSPWLAMRLSPSLRAAYDQIGGRPDAAPPSSALGTAAVHPMAGLYGGGERQRQPLAPAYDEDGAPVWVQPGTAARDATARPAAGDAVDADSATQLSPGPGRVGETPSVTTPFSEGPVHEPANTAMPTPNSPLVAPGSSPPAGPLAAAAGADSVGGAHNEPVTAGTPLPQGSVRLEPQSERRQELVLSVISQLQETESVTGQGAYRTVRAFAGEENVQHIQEALQQSGGAEAVHLAANAFHEQVRRQQAEGVDDAAIYESFRRGEPAAELRATIDTSLTDAQLQALADVVLLPQRRLTRIELAAAIGEAAARSDASEQDVAHLLGTRAHFGSQTGNVRGVLAGAQELHMTPVDLTRLAEAVQRGLQEEVMAELTARGRRPEAVRALAADLTALPELLSVPLTTAQREEHSS